LTHAHSFGTWKNWELDSAKDTVTNFRDLFTNKGEGWYPEDEANYSFADTFIYEDSEYWGRASGYNANYPGSYFDCLAAIGIDGRTSLSASKKSIGHELNYDSEFRPILVRFAGQWGETLTPRETWMNQADQAERFPNDKDYGRHEYPWLIAYPFDMPLADLPRPQPEADIMSCDALWIARNRIFHDNGYCFGGQRGILEFGNDGCYTKSPELSDAEAALVKQYKSLEMEKGC
jgi:hypothetical protein